MLEAAKYRDTADELDAVAQAFDDAEVRDVYRTLARQWRELAAHREADRARLAAADADAPAKE